MAAGLAHQWGTPTTNTTQVLLIAGITAMALTSVISGMEKGVKRLSEANLLLALLLLAFVLTVGPTLDIATRTVTSLGDYLAAIGPLSNWLGREDLDFMHGWTIFYWAWWISWSPFVGLFIARISRGRTVRELIACMLIIPTLTIAIWMNAFGGTAVSQYVDSGHLDVIAAVQAQQPEIALFALLESLPLANVTAVIGLVLIVVFFVTSSGLRIAGYRHHHRRRQAGRAGRPARVLVRLRGTGHRRTAARRRPRGRTGGHHRRRTTFHAGADRPVLQHLEGATRDTKRPGQLTYPRRGLIRSPSRTRPRLFLRMSRSMRSPLVLPLQARRAVRPCLVELFRTP